MHLHSVQAHDWLGGHWPLGGGAVMAFSGAAYGAVRVAEQRTLTRLPAVGDLFEVPLSQLFRWAARVERARKRRDRLVSEDPWGARLVMAFGQARAMNAMRREHHWRLVQLLECAETMIDDVVDGDRPSPCGTRKEFLGHITRLLTHCAEPWRLREPAVPVDVVLVYLLRAAPVLVGVDLTAPLQEIWDDYLPHAEGIIAGEPLANRETIKRLHRSFRGVMEVVATLHGLSPERARLFAECDEPSRTACNNLLNLGRDAARGQLQISREEVDENGVDPARLLQSRSWWELRESGIAPWCVAQAESHRAQCSAALPRMRDVLSQIEPRSAARVYEREWRSRLKWLDQIADTWGNFSDASPSDVPRAGFQRPWYYSFPGDDRLPAGAYAVVLGEAPLGWLQRIRLLGVAAGSLGIPVSDRTHETWLRVLAEGCVLDRLLDESPYPEQAKAIFDRLIVGPLPDPSELPIWVPRRTLDAAAVGHSAIDGLGSRERLIALMLELGEIAARKRAASSPGEYTRALRAEATATGTIFAECLSDDEQARPGYATFRRLCRLAFGCGVGLDTFVDLRADYANGAVNVPPTMRAKLIVAAFGARAVAAIVAHEPVRFGALIGHELGLVRLLPSEQAHAFPDTGRATGAGRV